jgi:hypothetical protein
MTALSGGRPAGPADASLDHPHLPQTGPRTLRLPGPNPLLTHPAPPRPDGRDGKLIRFLGGTGIARMRCHFSPSSLRSSRTCVSPRRNLVNGSIRTHASEIVLTGCRSNDSRITSR